MSSTSWKQPKNVRTDNPPRADEVQDCPPHHWTIAEGWQSCKKCSQREQVQALNDYSYRYPSRGVKKAPTAPDVPEVKA